MPNLLLIESPGKLKKLGQILGSGWIVKASMGHVRELANDGLDSLGFDLGETAIACRYQPRDARSKKVLSELRQAVKKADRVYTDPDREGETIGWHLQQALHLRDPQRVVYSEITPQAVRAAMVEDRPRGPSLILAPLIKILLQQSGQAIAQPPPSSTAKPTFPMLSTKKCHTVETTTEGEFQRNCYCFGYITDNATQSIHSHNNICPYD